MPGQTLILTISVVVLPDVTVEAGVVVAGVEVVGVEVVGVEVVEFVLLLAEEVVEVEPVVVVEPVATVPVVASPDVTIIGSAALLSEVEDTVATLTDFFALFC